MKLQFINSTPAGIQKVLEGLENKFGGKISDYVIVNLSFNDCKRNKTHYDIYDDDFLEPISMDIMFADENYNEDSTYDCVGASYLSLKERKKLLTKKLKECNQKIECYEQLNSK